MKQTDKSPQGFYMIGIAALFLAGFFLLVVFGAQSYRNTVTGQTGNMQTRVLLSYLSTCVKANDARGAVEVREDPENGQVLVVTDESGYATRIYRYEGELVEDFAAADAELRPEEAQVIGQTSVFELEELSDGVLAVTTDAGRALLRIRSEGGGDT